MIVFILCAICILCAPIYHVYREINKQGWVEFKREFEGAGCFPIFISGLLFLSYCSLLVMVIERGYHLYLYYTCEPIIMTETTCCERVECYEVDQYANERCNCIEYKECMQPACMIGNKPVFLDDVSYMGILF